MLDYVAPLAIVLVMSMMKELYDDIKRHNRDRALNNY